MMERIVNMLIILLKMSVFLTLLFFAALVYGHYLLPDKPRGLTTPIEIYHGCTVAVIVWGSLFLGSVCWVITGFLWIWSW